MADFHIDHNFFFKFKKKLELMESCSGTGFHSFSQRKSNGGYETANTTLKKNNQYF